MQQRTIGKLPLLFTSVSTILGSGWLFSSYYSTLYAGPSSIISWLLGGLFVIIIAFVYAELVSMVPITGSSTRIPHYTHGSTVSFMFAWMIWLSYATFVATETQAVLQYLNFFFPGITKSTGGLTTDGLIYAAITMLGISIINVYSLKWLIRLNNILTLFKIFIPLIISISILLYFFTPVRAFTPAGSPFIPFGSYGILQAISTGGILFAFSGFKQACEVAGEVENPKKAIPFAIIGSVALTLILFILLQIAFLTSLTDQNLLSGWKNLSLTNNQSPLASILDQNDFHALVPLLYIGAIIAPLASGFMYCSSAARSLYGMSKNGYIPKFFEYLTPSRNPIYAIIANFLLGMMLFLPLPGWDKMVTFLTSLMSVTYSVGPVALLALRYQVPNMERPIKLPFDKFWAYVAFYICTLLTYWTGWENVSKLAFSLVLSLIVFTIYHLIVQRGKGKELDLKASIWIWPYFTGIIFFSYMGSFGGKNIIPFGLDLFLISIFCLIILYLGVRFRLHESRTKELTKLPSMKDF